MKESDTLRAALDNLRSQYTSMSDKLKGTGLNPTPYKSTASSSPYEGTAAAVAGSNFLRDHEIKKLKYSVGNLEQQVANIEDQLGKMLAYIQQNKQVALNEFEYKVGEQTAKLESQIRRDRYKNVEIISIVAAFFAFIATEFQLFAHLKSFWQFLSISLVVFGCTSFFALIMARVARDPGEYKGVRDFIKNNKLLIVSILAMLAGATISFFADKSVAESRDNYTKTRHQACGDLTNDMKSFNFSAKDSEQKYDQLRKRYDALQCGSPDLLK